MSERKQQDIALIRELSLLFGPTGCEGDVADVIDRKIRPVCDGVCRDKMGNVLALLRGGDRQAPNRKKVMISAHMDEVGVMVTEITEEGFLRFDTVGGIHVSVLEGRKVILGDETKRICGVIASKAVHHKKREERKQPTPMDKLYVDIGVQSREEAESHVSVGDFGVFDSEFYTFGKHDNMIKSKALDDRMGCAALIRVMEAMYAERPAENFDFYFCFTVREEIGLSGAKVAAQTIRPDLAIVLETTAVADLLDVAPGRRVADQGKGGVLSVMDRSTVYDRELLTFALSVAQKKAIPAQLKRYVSGGNDAGSIHKTGIGVRSLALSVPTRYLHSPSCVARWEDYCAVRDLTEALLREMTVQGLSKDDMA